MYIFMCIYIQIYISGSPRGLLRPTRLYHTGPQYGVGVKRFCDGARFFADGKIYIYIYIYMCVCVYVCIYKYIYY